MDVDHFIEDVAGCGWFQVVLALVIYLAEIGFTWSTAFMSFGNYNPGWTCELGNVSESFLTDPDVNETSTNHTLDLTSSNQSSVPGTCDIFHACAKVNFNPEASTIVTEWTLICDRNWIMSSILSFQMVGMAIGSLGTGPLADRFGRKVTFFLGNGLLFVSNLAAYFANTWQIFAVCRFVITLSCGIIMGSKAVHLLEFTPSKWRVLMIVFPSYNIGAAVFVLILYLLRDWRQLHMAVAIVGLLNFALTFWLPESLRWLAVHGKESKVDTVTEKVTKYNRRAVPKSTSFNFSSSEGTTTEKRANVFLLFKPPVLSRTVLISLVLMFVAILYYSIAYGIKNLYGNFYLNLFIFSVISIPFAPLVTLMSNFVGRRTGNWILLIASGALSFLIVLIFFVTSGEVRGLTITFLAMAISVGLDTGWCYLGAYTGELFPTSLRASGIAVVKFATRVGGIIAPYMIPADFSMLYVCYIISGVLCVVCCLLLVGLPETKGAAMADTVQQIVADSKAKEVSHQTPNYDNEEAGNKLIDGSVRWSESDMASI